MNKIIAAIAGKTKVGALIGSLLTGGTILGLPHAPKLLEHTHPEFHDHNDGTQVEIVQTPLWAQEIKNHIDQKYIMTCGEDK